MPSDLVLKAMNATHRVVLRLSGGRLGTTVGGMPALRLTTTGRKSGRPHSVMLTAPIIDGDTIVIVASRGGDDAHPAWFLNLRDDPRVRVSLQDGPERAMTARIATAEERAALWPKATAAYQGYAGYQRRTTREIPLVLLSPAE